MVDDPFRKSGRAVTSVRLSRLGVFGRLAGGVADGMMAKGEHDCHG